MALHFTLKDLERFRVSDIERSSLGSLVFQTPKSQKGIEFS